MGSVPNLDETVAAVEYAITRCQEVPPEGADFAESVREKLVSIRDTISRTGRVSDKQARAIENMAAGVEKWLSPPSRQ